MAHAPQRLFRAGRDLAWGEVGTSPPGICFGMNATSKLPGSVRGSILRQLDRVSSWHSGEGCLGRAEVLDQIASWGISTACPCLVHVDRGGLPALRATQAERISREPTWSWARARPCRYSPRPEPVLRVLSDRTVGSRVLSGLGQANGTLAGAPCGMFGSISDALPGLYYAWRVAVLLGILLSIRPQGRFCSGISNHQYLVWCHSHTLGVSVLPGLAWQLVGTRWGAPTPRDCAGRSGSHP